MKSRLFNLLLVGIFCSTTAMVLCSCNDEWKDEQYEQYIRKEITMEEYLAYLNR